MFDETKKSVETDDFSQKSLESRDDASLPPKEILERRKLILEITELVEKRSHRLISLIPLISVLVSVLALAITSTFQSEQLRDNHQKENQERFQKAVEGLGHAVPAERLSAVIALTDLAYVSSERNQEAAAVLAERLNAEPDDGVAEFMTAALSHLGPSALTQLTQVNRRDQVRLARVCGKFVGLQLLSDGKGVEAQESAIQVLQEHVRRQDLPFIQDSRSFRVFFELSPLIATASGVLGKGLSFDSERDEVMRSKELPGDALSQAQQETDKAIRSLWINSEAIVSTIRQLNGHLSGFDLQRTALIIPNLMNLDLKGLDLRLAVWERPVLTGTDLSYSNMILAAFPYADLRNAKLNMTNLQLANFGVPIEGDALRDEGILSISQDSVDVSLANWWELSPKSYLYGLLSRKYAADLPAMKERRQSQLQQPEAKSYLQNFQRNSDNRM